MDGTFFHPNVVGENKCRFAVQLSDKTSQQHETEVEIVGINCSLKGPRAPAQFCIFLQIYGKFDLQKCCSVFPSYLNLLHQDECMIRSSQCLAVVPNDEL